MTGKTQHSQPAIFCLCLPGSDDVYLPEVSARSKLRRHVKIRRRSSFLQRTVEYPAFEEQKCSRHRNVLHRHKFKTSAQQAANEFVRNSDSGSVYRSADSQSRRDDENKKIDYLINDASASFAEIWYEL
jgi:hypothetical protein